MTVALIAGLVVAVTFLGSRLVGARAEIADLLVQNARLKRRLERDAR